MRGSQVVAVDYGSLAPLYQRSMYRGNVVCASDRVLRELHSGPFMFPIFPADDLHALVRCVFMLLVRGGVQLRGAERRPAGFVRDVDRANAQN